MKFDPDSEYQKHRDVQGGVWYIQNGHRFSVGHKDLGKVGSLEKPPKDEPKLDKKEKKRLKAIRKRAAKKLEGFAENRPSGSVQEALQENRAAMKASVAAEEQVSE